MLQNARGKASCPLLSTLFKQIANSVPGKFHQNSKRFIQAKPCTSKEVFCKTLEDPSFCDYMFVSPESCITIHDGILMSCRNLPGENFFLVVYISNQVKNHNSLVYMNQNDYLTFSFLFTSAISAWTYSYSKLLLWETFYYFNARLSYETSGFQRLNFTG